MDLRVAEPVRPHGAGVENPAGVSLTKEELDRHIVFMGTALGELMRRISAPKRLEPYVDLAQGNSSAAGALTMRVMHAREGFAFRLLYVTVEAGTFDASPYTPASPFTGASFWFGLFASDDPTNVAQGQLLDFIPNGVNTSLPAFGDYSASDGRLIRSGKYLVFYMVGGPASKRITVRYEGKYEAVEI